MDDKISALVKGQRTTLRGMAAEVGVSYVSVRKRIYDLGLGAEYEKRGACGFAKGWEPWQEQLLRDHWHGMTIKEIASAVGKTACATSRYATDKLCLGKKVMVRHGRSAAKRKVKPGPKKVQDERMCRDCRRYPCFKGQQEARHDYNFAANGCRLYRKRE